MSPTEGLKPRLPRARQRRPHSHAGGGRCDGARVRRDGQPDRRAWTGEIVVRRNGRNEFLAIGEGLVEITGDRVAIATDMAIRAADIDEELVEAARQRAEARLRDRISD